MENVQSQPAEHHGPTEHFVTIIVNEHPVEVHGPRITGSEIKKDAIAQGVLIDINFQLSQDLGNRQTQIIGDDELVTVNRKSRFVAVAPDDPS